MQTEFPFSGDEGRSPWTPFDAYDAKRPHIKAALITALREDLASFHRCSIQRACETLRLRDGLHVPHGYRAGYARAIARECPGLAGHLKMRPCTYDAP